jgi:predicted nucleotidyltransferase
MTNKNKTRTAIPKIVDMIVGEYQPSKIILFGSFAYGKPDRDSDVDLLVVSKKHLTYEDTYKIRRTCLKDLSIPVQLVCVTEKEFTETKDVIGGITYPANKYGKMLYEKP